MGLNSHTFSCSCKNRDLFMQQKTGKTHSRLTELLENLYSVKERYKLFANVLYRFNNLNSSIINGWIFRLQKRGYVCHISD